MKSQSLIGRVTPEITPAISSSIRSLHKNTSYYVRYYSFPLTVFSIVAGVAIAMLLIFGLVNVKNNNKMKEQAKLYHYAIGSNAKCNYKGDQRIDGSSPLADGNGWFNCKVVAVSGNNEYYTTSYYNPDSHKTETYKFQIQYVSNK